VAEYVALLRGIAPSNPKMHNTELRRVFDELGFDAVRTVIASGNVCFRSPERSRARLENAIEVALADHLGAPCCTIVRSRSQLERLLRSDVFDGHEDAPASRLNVTFLKRRAQQSEPVPTPGEGARIVAVRDQAVFSVVDSTRSKTPDLMNVLERAYGKDVTTRTWKTVGRIAAALAALDA